MKILKSHLVSILKKGKREDGRDLMEYRDLEVEVNPIQRANGSARVRLGETDVIVGVKLDVGEPFPDNPDEGIQIVNAELSPLSSPEFESGPPGPKAIELARVVDRGLRESEAVDMEKLAIKSGEKVWSVFVDIYSVNAGGNLLDASALGAIIALKNARFPKYNKKKDEVTHDEFTKKKLPVENIPVMCTFGKAGGAIFLDPSGREEKVMDARLSVTTLEDGSICSMQKGGNGTFTIKEINELSKKAKKYTKELRKHIE